MMPFGSVFSEDLLDSEPENNTIPLWGPTWCKDTITWQISNADKISANALAEMRDGIDEWAHHAPTGITLEEFDPNVHDSLDMVLKFKRGGGQVQGQALQRSDSDGCFINVKINVSGQAFGQVNPGNQVKSITIQEVGHGLGLLHSDKTSDVMYGTVQDPPNVLLSECDLTAWEAVVAGANVDSVTCNVTDPGPGPGPDPANPTIIDITNGPDHDTQGKDGNYSNRDTVHILIQVGDAHGGLAEIPVHVTIDAPKSSLSGDTTTNDSGQAHIHYKVNAGRDGSGPYHIYAEVDDLSCIDESGCHADFEVS